MTKKSSLIQFFLLLSICATWISQSLMDASTVIMLLICFFIAVQKNDFSGLYKNAALNKILPVMLLYFTTAALGYYFNARPGAQAAVNLTKFNWIFLLYLLTWAFHYLDFTISQKRIQFFGFLLFVAALYGFNIFLNSGIDLISERDAVDRIVGFVNSATYHAHIGGFLFVFLSVYLAIQKKLLKPFSIVLLLSLFLTIFFTKTRGALLALFLTWGTFLFYQYRFQFVKWMTVAILALSPLLFFSEVRDIFFREGSDSCRKQLIDVHINMVKKYPLLGIGYRDNMRNLADFWPFTEVRPECNILRKEGSQAHNQILNVAATTGLLGLLFYLMIVFYFLWLNLKWLKSDRSALAIACLFSQIYFFLSCMTEITFEFAKIRYLLLVIWAVVAYAAHKKNSLKIEVR